MVNMDKLLKNKNLFSLPELSQFIKTNISKSSSKVIDYMEDIDFDEDSDKDEFEDEDNPKAFDDQDEILSNSDDEVEDKGSVLTSDVSDTGKKIFKVVVYMIKLVHSKSTNIFVFVSDHH